MKDEKILRFIAQNAEKGIDELLKKYQPFIEYLLRGMFDEYPQDMEKCLNDVKRKLRNDLKVYDDNKNSSLKTYITQVVRNIALERVQQIREGENQIDKNLDVIEDGNKGNVFLEEQKRLVLEGINKLKKTDKEIFLRKYYYLQPAAQIAAELGRSEKSIESRLSKIRKKLKDIVGEV